MDSQAREIEHGRWGCFVLGFCLIGSLASGPLGCDRGTASVGVRDSASSGGAPVRAKSIPIVHVPVAVDEARTGAISTHYETTATLEVEKQAEVVSRVAGVVRKLLVEEGDAVKAGSPLLIIDNEEYRHRLDQAEATTLNLQRRHARLEQMVSEDLVSVEEFDTVQSELAAAKAAEELARLNLDYTTVVAPFDGRVVTRSVDIGKKVSIDTPLFTVADFQPLLARVHVPAKEFKRIQIDQDVDLVLDSTGERLQGRITLVSPIIDPTTGTIKVTIEIDKYPPGTRPGDFAKVRIVTERRESTTLVAKNAVFSDKGDRVVFVAAGTGAERRVVTVGFSDDMHAEIVAGVRPGEEVVVKGQRSLKNGSPLKILERDGEPIEPRVIGGGAATSARRMP